MFKSQNNSYQKDRSLDDSNLPKEKTSKPPRDKSVISKLPINSSLDHSLAKEKDPIGLKTPKKNLTPKPPNIKEKLLNTPSEAKVKTVNGSPPKQVKPIEKELKPAKQFPANDQSLNEKTQKDKTPLKDSKASKDVSKKLSTKEKDYGSLFTLLLPPQLEELDVKIESKVRLQETIQSKDWKYLQKASQNYIDGLSKINQELLEQFNKLKKEKKKDFNQVKLKNLSQQLEVDLKEKKNILDEINKLQEKIIKTNSELVSQKEKMEEELNQEISNQQVIKTEITIKEIELDGLKENIMQVSSQTGQIKSLNAQFNLNIEKINRNIEKANNKYYEAKAKSENSAVLKDKIIESQLEIIENETKILKYYRRFKEIQKFLQNKDNEIKNITQLEVKIEEALKNLPDIQLEHSAQALERILKNLSEPKRKLARPNHKNKPLEDSIKIKNTILLNKINLRKLEKKSKEKAFPGKEPLLSEVREVIQENQNIFQEKTDYFTKQVAFLQSQISSLSKKQEDIKINFNLKQEGLEKMKKSLDDSSEKLSALKKTNEYASQIIELRKKIEENTVLLFKHEEGKEDTAANDKEKQIANVVLQLDILKQEIAVKDTEVVLKVREKQKNDEKLENLKTQLQKLSTKVKTAEADILSKINEEIESKEKQIEVLKEMLRGSQAEKKLKDVVLLNYKSKLDESSKTSKKLS